MKKNKAKSLKKRNLKKLQYGSLSIALTVAFIAAILLGNAAISYVTDRYSLKADISAEGLYQISEQTEIMLKNLDQPVRAYILMSEANAYAAGNDYYAVASEFLKRFVTLSDGKFSVEFIDVYKNPAFMNKYDEESGISAGSFIIESDTRYRVCSMYDLYEVSVSYSEDGTATQYISGFQADETFASMLHYVTTGELPTVVQITGHREYYDEVFLEIFEKNNYEILECNLSMEEIPASADIILISSPKVDFTEAEIEKIDKYLREDFGSAMVFVDFDSYDLDLFELYFEEWGIGVEQKMVMDSARAISMPFMVVPYVQNNDFIDGFSYDENTMIVAPNSRKLDVLFETSGSYTTTVLLKTGDTSYAKDYSVDEPISVYAKEDGDETGPFPMAILSEYFEWSNNRAYTGRVVFFGTSGVTNETMLETAALSNNRFLTHVINYINPTTDTVTLEARDLTSTSMAILTEQANVILVLLVLVIPVITLGLGLLVYMRRKNK
ncbi:MAG: GldG family protein [Clostridia bacterium]|nr:hypothetical protein [Oscillospiraceae bacterium]MBR6748059.1 GldG family protein [Clostridia bacterium]